MTTAPVLTKALSALRSGFNAAFPVRDKSSDGWIGDADHQLHVSGHNPDDTAGSLAEYSDSDTIAEVRAIDVDKDFNAPGVAMLDVINKILATPSDLARLRYIIFCPPVGPLGASVPTIWSWSNGWRPARYYGSNPHDKHTHFSGDPGTDDDDRPWSVSTMGDDMSLTAAEHANLVATDERVRVALIEGRDSYADDGLGTTKPWIVTAVKGLLADVAELKARPPVQAGPVDPAALKAVLLDPEVLAAIGKAVLDEQHRRDES